MPQLTIQLLGSPELTVGGQPITFRTRKVLALLVYLIVEGGMHSREALMTLLWSETPASKASVVLRVTLSRLRQALQPAGEVMITSGGQVGFNFSRPAALDLDWLSTAVLATTSPEELARILEMDRGEFLEGFSLPDAPEFDHWVAVHREACQLQVETVYDRLSKYQLANWEITNSVETAKRWVRRAPLSEAAYRRLMAAQALNGDRPAALQAYAECRAMLETEFGLEPARETAILAENIAHEQQPKEPGERLAAPRLPGILSRVSGRREALLPFEGRAEQHSQLVTAFHQVSQGGVQVAVLMGEAGIGKTRLINAFREWVMLDSPDVEIWDGRAFEMGGRLPYQPVIEALRQRLEHENAPEDLLDDVWLAELSQLMPELRARYPDLPPPMTGDAGFVRSRLFSAVATLGNALSSRHPVIFILDDMQWADADTRDMIHYLENHWVDSGAPILLLIAVRQESFAADPQLREWLAQLGREGPLTRLFLDSLSGPAVQQLVNHLADPQVDGDVTNEFGAWLWAETQGSPFFIDALLHMLIEEEILATTETEGRPRYDFASALTQVKSAGRVQVPEGVRDAILSRLDRLSEREADILLAASVLGRESRFETLCQVANVSEGNALDGVENLLNRRLMVENNASRRPYTLAHDYIREVVYHRSREARRRVFHRRALIALEAGRAPAAECAYHALVSLLDEPTFRYSLIAGNEALRANAFQESLAHYDLARDAARRMGEQDTAIDDQLLRQLFQKRGRALELIEDYPAARANYLEALELAAARKDQSLELAALIAQCDIHSRHTPLFNPPAAREFGQAALELARKLKDQAAEAAALGGLMFATLYGGEDAQITLAYGEASLSLTRELGLIEQMGTVLVHLWMPYIAQKQLGAAFDSNREAEAVWRELGNLPKLVETYDMLKFLHILSGDNAAVLAAVAETVRLSTSIGNKFYEANARMTLSLIYHQQGRFGEALREISAAIALWDENSYPVIKQANHFYRMVFYLDAGALDQAEYHADLLNALKDSMVPIFKSYFLNYIAQVKIACGKFGEGQMVLEQALEFSTADQVWSHYIVWIAITDAYLQLALGRPERAFSRLEERLQSYRQAGFCFNLAEELWLRGRVQMALGEIEEAKEILLEAKTIAEEKEERIYLWQILAALGDLDEMCGGAAEAEKWRVQACEIIQYIADRAGDEEDLRASFLAQPEVVRVLTRSNLRIAD
jgi:DNA-binding SARP family transcriptional activator/tetratricopeptide (TPR) repeat protein